MKSTLSTKEIKVGVVVIQPIYWPLTIAQTTRNSPLSDHLTLMVCYKILH